MSARRDSAQRLGGNRLIVAHVVWLVLAGVMIALFVAAVPARFDQLLTVTPRGDNALVVLSAAEAAALQQHGIPIMVYALYFISLEVLFASVYGLFGALLYLRRGGEPLALFASLALIAVGVLIPGTMRVLDTSSLVLGLLIHLVQVIGWASFFTSFYVFPDGRFVPQWTRFITVAFVFWGIVWIFVPMANAFNWPLPLALLAFGMVSLSGVLAQLYRYIRISAPVERQQTKWVLFGFAGATLGTLIFATPGIVWTVLNSPGLPRVVYHVAGVGIFAISLLLIPATIEMAVRRYRLWAIDPLINRVLVYTLLTLGLAIFYGVSVVALQQIFRNITGVGNSLAIVLSTLAIAALFNPARQRIQNGIDRRFYRRKYDATIVLARFNAKIREQVDLDDLTGELLAIVYETFEPRHASLWLNMQDKKTKDEG